VNSVAVFAGRSARSAALRHAKFRDAARGVKANPGLTKRYDAVAKLAGGHLIFARRGDAQSVAGAPLARITLTPSDGSAYPAAIASRESPGTMTAYVEMSKTLSGAQSQLERASRRKNPNGFLRQGVRRSSHLGRAAQTSARGMQALMHASWPPRANRLITG
jgi:phage protein D